ncbi:adenylate/guanylate cyclase domain-containing protein [Sulfitobacter aestuariivivens]|uniref:Adenylate/guanylate cyclase domain-containing protein n=1 Tax=Sulfitobacter aestuariivivens TaxID=2766981 RepID=A0A927D435_9RHOB|nr:adenylate/guanylate cyclase domain-containing protein [Sulfitobacter aestuariivivens]MBD3664758.1 adenylate/guanylate cyclase domain-containing protein [Sulfitobacter aestuariivivens]
MLCLVGSISSVLYMVMYGWMGLYPMAVACIPAAIVVPLSPVLAIYRERLTLIFTVGTLLVVFSLLTYFAGRDTLLHLFIVLVVLNIVILRGTRAPTEAALASLVSTMVVVACHYRFAVPALGDAITPRFTENLAALNIFALGLMLVGALLSLSYQVRAAQDALTAEHARSEALLLNLLPEEIAVRLKDRPGEVIADGLPAVTLLFADIADFTPRSARMSPAELVNWLNRIFSTFDLLTAERGLEKIKTIGDAYMVAAGLPVAREDHAHIIADMALAMQAEVAQLSEELGERIALRIGIHSGPAVAGVIGTSKVFYDVWGDTVNTASRMESHGEPGRIQVTASTRALLEGHYQFERRGPIEIKGIGQIETWWLEAGR